MVSDPLLRTVTRFLNLCENDSGSPENEYRAVYIYRDGNGGRRQVTLARGFTEDGGNLAKVIQEYLANGGTSDVLKTKLSKVGKGVLASDREFIKALGAASTEQAMREAQDSVFLSAYLSPAFRWAEMSGCQLPLSFAVAADSFLHSGRMSPHLISRFSEKTPARGGDERAWMTRYLNERLAWFTRASGVLHTCVFRPKFFLTQIERGNWELACPLAIPEKGRIC